MPDHHGIEETFISIMHVLCVTSLVIIPTSIHKLMSSEGLKTNGLKTELTPPQG